MNVPPIPENLTFPMALNSQLVANYLEALGTISAVIVALFTQVYLTWRKRPRLTLKCPVGDSGPEGSEDFVMIRSPDGGIVEYWMRLRVCAKAGKRTATNVQCRVAQVRRLDGPHQVVLPSGPLNWSSVGPAPQSILAGSWLRVDVLAYYVRHPETKKSLNVAIGYKFSRGHYLTALSNGTYALDLHLGSDDSDTSYWRLTLEHTENPSAESDEEIRTQIKIVELVELRNKRFS